MADDTQITGRAYAAIRRDIMRCTLAPGSEVSAAHLAEHFGFGLGPVRIALSRLEQEGLIKALPRKGYLVIPVTLKSVLDIFEMRALLEPYVARQAAGKIDPAKLAFLDAVCNRDYNHRNAESRLEYLEANRAFHVFIAESAGNQKLTGTLSQILDEMTRILFMGLGLRNRTEEMQHAHKALVEALVANDAEEAERLAAQEVLSSKQMVLDAILSSPAIQDVPLAVAPQAVGISA